MKSFQIANGDLVLGASGFSEVTGESKVRQDLGIAVREPYGCDRFHPQWGCLLDSYVGAPVTQETQALAQAEVIRIVANYSAGQQSIMANDSLSSRKARFSSNEVIRSITAVDVVQQIDVLYVKVRLETLTSAEVVLTSTVRI